MKSMCVLLLIVYLLNIFSTACGSLPTGRTPTLVSTDLLHGYIQKNPAIRRAVRIIETSFNPDAASNYTAEYKQGHIPQAVYFDINRCATSTSTILRNLPEIQCITDYIRGLGVWPDTHVIVYARVNAVYQAFRTWWTFRVFGHRKVSVLDGGFSQWTTDVFQTSTSIPVVERSTFEGKFDNSLVRTYGDMVENVKTNREQVIDARSQSNIARTGVIPGAKFIDYTTLFKAGDIMKSEAQIKAIFEGSGVNLTQPMVSYCNTGMTATVIAGAAHVLGLDIPVYYMSGRRDGSHLPPCYYVLCPTVAAYGFLLQPLLENAGTAYGGKRNWMENTMDHYLSATLHTVLFTFRVHGMNGVVELRKT